MLYINKHKGFCACLAVLLGLVELAIPNASTANIENSNERASQLTTVDQNQPSTPFEYQLEGRPDPFLPFISKQVANQRINADEIIDEDIELTGMRQFEPGQLTLVAVMFANNRAMAMVEDVTGKGYILTEGMPIGRRGVIRQIDNEQVTVIETAHTRAGRELETKIFMRLNKEGDK